MGYQGGLAYRQTAWNFVSLRGRGNLMRFTIYQSQHIPEQMVFDRAFVNREVPTDEMPEIINEYDCVGVYEINSPSHALFIRD